MAAPPPRAGAPAPQGGFEGLLAELGSLGARLLEQHRRELDAQRHESEAGRGSAWPSVAGSEACPEEAPARASSVSEGRGRTPAVEHFESLATFRAEQAPTWNTMSNSKSAQASYTVLESWVSAVPISQLAAVGPQAAGPERQKKASVALKKTGSALSLTVSKMSFRSARSKSFEDMHDAFVFKSDGFLSKWLMVHPSLWLATLWSFLSLLLIAYDTVTVPIYNFYRFDYVPGTILLFDWFARIFWTLDILLALVTGFHKEGYIEMRPKLVALAYLQSWLLFDLLLVVSDWLAVALKNNTTLMTVPALRALRLMRVFRLLRLGRLSHTINEILLFVSDGVAIVVSVLKLSIGLCIGIHLVACMWYGVGDSSRSGWTSNEALLESAAFSEQADMFSVHWVITQLHGTSLTPPQTFLEICFQGVVLLGAHAFAAFFVASMTQAMISRTDAKNLQMQQAFRRYTRRRRISPGLSFQVQKHLGKPSGRTALQDAVEVENKLVESLPLALQQQLHEEVRLPLLKPVPLFRRDGFSDHRFLRQLCCRAISGVSLISGELVFSLGDSCKRMLVVESGIGVYVKLRRSCEHYSLRGKTLTKYHRTSYQRTESEEEAEQVVRQRGQHISEAALWARWTNHGELFSEGVCTMLILDSSDFASVVSEYEFTRISALKYACCFVSWLNDRAREYLQSDVMDTPKNLIDEYMQKMISDSAFIFISHYKEEAGSDAALIEEGMRRIIKENPAHPAFNLSRPVFLDSNDLQETYHIPSIIRSSHNVVLLLTDNVLTRPWVLIEIVTALRASVPIHLVTIQRPGVGFQFPSADSIERLAAGAGLSSSAQALLRAEGITAEDLKLLGNAFHRIALPFSPHKSANIREAELLDIMNRCELSGSGVAFRCPTDIIPRVTAPPDTKHRVNTPPLPNRSTSVPEASLAERPLGSRLQL
ncbi:unnamed protein product [Prorocentrum cordatum]|uniref:Ion transport domain-containing protein n=1 Tax=Prorocentrum cordatum TaxID=2364126 RepID=A0ABN9XIK8_9DINO|nr:unnamed protein product [Polarella glacialis]